MYYKPGITIRVNGQYNGSDILAQTIVFTVIIIVIIIIIPPAAIGIIMQYLRKKNNKTCTACTIAALRFGMQLPADSLYIGTSETAIFRVDVQRRFTYYYYYYIV